MPALLHGGAKLQAPSELDELVATLAAPLLAVLPRTGFLLVFPLLTYLTLPLVRLPLSRHQWSLELLELLSFLHCFSLP